MSNPWGWTSNYMQLLSTASQVKMGNNLFLSSTAHKVLNWKQWGFYRCMFSLPDITVLCSYKDRKKKKRLSNIKKGSLFLILLHRGLPLSIFFLSVLFGLFYAKCLDAQVEKQTALHWNELQGTKQDLCRVNQLLATTTFRHPFSISIFFSFADKENLKEQAGWHSWNHPKSSPVLKAEMLTIKQWSISVIWTESTRVHGRA